MRDAIYNKVFTAGARVGYAEFHAGRRNYEVLKGTWIVGGVVKVVATWGARGWGKSKSKSGGRVEDA